MRNSMNVHPELLAASAALAASQSQRVSAAHSAASQRVDAALPGWVGNSRAALTAAAQRWADLSTGLNLRIYQHSEALRVTGLTFAAADAEHAGSLTPVTPREAR